ncbi:TlpA family protein disulfide reductase [Pedobacter sp. MW01-1-1]|uniref:TlpA family protein disulfide reductase n=1 Tax=Pedobacter sp. MW01-1-1 TaxID=3383027 RepID=UPI003FEDC072
MKKQLIGFTLFLCTISPVFAQYSPAFKKAALAEELKWQEAAKKNHPALLLQKLNDQAVAAGLSSAELEMLNALKPFNFVRTFTSYINEHKTIDSDVKLLLQKMPVLPLNGSEVTYALSSASLKKSYDNYYFLKLLKEGVALDSADGGGTANTSMTNLFNKYHYQKLAYYLKNGNAAIQAFYLGQVAGVLRYNGYTPYLAEIYAIVNSPIIMVTKEKNEVLVMFKKYEHLQVGKQAPLFKLPNDQDKMISLADLKGKVVVIDTWATWCSWCIENLPHYVELKEKFKERKDVVFLTISIDEPVKKYEWMYTLPNVNLLGFQNLLASRKQSTFQQDYMITGVPRYMVIDKAGKIVSVNLPGADSEIMVQAIEKSLN